MALAVHLCQHGGLFCPASGKSLHKELLSSGYLTLNFAPTVDVNLTRCNPVINVRSYGLKMRRIVVKWAVAQMAHLQGQGMMATLKHFP